MKADEFLRDNGIVKCSRIVDDLTEQEVDSDFVKDLKRLVESHELVEECGGLDKAKERVALKEKLPNPNVFYVLVVSSAIDDVESCQ